MHSPQKMERHMGCTNPQIDICRHRRCTVCDANNRVLGECVCEAHYFPSLIESNSGKTVVH